MLRMLTIPNDDIQNNFLIVYFVKKKSYTPQKRMTAFKKKLKCESDFTTNQTYTNTKAMFNDKVNLCNH